MVVWLYGCMVVWLHCGCGWDGGALFIDKNIVASFPRQLRSRQLGVQRGEFTFYYCNSILLYSSFCALTS